MTGKVSISNRKGLLISVLVEQASDNKRVVILMHGLGGFKEQPHIRRIAEAFKEVGYLVVSFDTTNSLGESGGSYEQATVTNYLHDLEDVIEWVHIQYGYTAPIVLVGHSIGALCITLFAEKHPDKIRAIAPMSPVVSGALSLHAQIERDALFVEHWKETGWIEYESASRPGTIKRLPWTHMEDRIRYDLLPAAALLTLPVLIVVGDEDTTTPPEQAKLLFDRLRCKKELHVISGAPHTFTNPAHLEQLFRIFREWIHSIEKT